MIAGEPSLGRRIATGAAWLVGARIATRLIDFVTLLLLAHLLTPRDFGLVAIAMTLVQIVEAVFELPVAQVLVRSGAITEPMLRTAFTLSVLRGLALAAALAALAWPFAAFYGDTRLVPLVCFLAIAPGLRGVASPKLALFARAIDFRRDVAIEATGKICALLAASSLALATHSYWAIALGTVTTPAVMAIASFVAAPWRPRLGLGEARDFMGFLGWTTAAQALSALNWQIDWLVLGRIAPRAELGAFSVASDVANVPELGLVRPLTRPLLSAFSLIRDERARLAEAYLRTVGTIVTVGLPVMLGLSVLAEPAVRLALGAKWSGAAPYLQWLALAAAPSLFVAPLNALAIALGRPSAALRRNLAEACVKLPLAIVGGLLFGIYGVIAARAVASGVTVIVAARLVKGLTGAPLRAQAARSARPFAAGGMMVLALLAARPLVADCAGMTLALRLSLLAGIGLAAYCAALIALWRRAGRPAGLERVVDERLRALRPIWSRT